MKYIGKECYVISNNPGYDGDIPFPPIGSVGICMSEIDEYDEYEIWCPEYPGPIHGEPLWTVHKTMIVFQIDDMLPMGCLEVHRQDTKKKGQWFNTGPLATRLLVWGINALQPRL